MNDEKWLQRMQLSRECIAIEVMLQEPNSRIGLYKAVRTAPDEIVDPLPTFYYETFVDDMALPLVALSRKAVIFLSKNGFLAPDPDHQSLHWTGKPLEFTADYRLKES